MMLLTALNVIGSLHERKGHQIAETVQGMVEQNLRLRKNDDHQEARKSSLPERSVVLVRV